LENLLASQPDRSLPLSHHLCARANYLSVRNDNIALPPGTIGHLEKALAGINNDPLLYLDAACIYLYQSGHEVADQDKNRELAMDFLHKSVAAGAPRLAVYAEGPFLGGLLERLSPEEQDAMQVPEQKPLSTPLYYEPAFNTELSKPTSSL
jgi:hypothetical protein